MKKVIFLATFLFFTLTSWSQADPELMKRVDSMLKITSIKDIDRMLDFTYPKLFTIVTRDQMKEALINSYESEDFSISFDSVKMKTIFPAFTASNGQYVKISYTMQMHMKFKEVLDSSSEKIMLPLMDEKFGAGSSSFDKQTNTININSLSYLVGIKDSYSKDWSFVNYEEEEGPLHAMLFSKEILQKLKEYK